MDAEQFLTPLKTKQYKKTNKHPPKQNKHPLKKNKLNKKHSTQKKAPETN